MDDGRVHPGRRCRFAASASSCSRGAWQAQRCVHAAARRPGDADEAAHRQPAGLVVLDVRGDRARVVCVPPADIPQHGRPHHRDRPGDSRVLDEAQHPGLEHPAPDPLLGAWHLDDASPILYVGPRWPRPPRRGRPRRRGSGCSGSVGSARRTRPHRCVRRRSTAEVFESVARGGIAGSCAWRLLRSSSPWARICDCGAAAPSRPVPMVTKPAFLVLMGPTTVSRCARPA